MRERILITSIIEEFSIDAETKEKREMTIDDKVWQVT
jgi:hypothetical protein